MNADGKYTRCAYTTQGQLETSWGDVPYPVKFAYDDQGRRKDMWTYRDSSKDWDAIDEWPTDTGTGDHTSWDYDEATGLLETKTYPKRNALDTEVRTTTYSYTPDGRLSQRTWARGEYAVYDYYTGQEPGLPVQQAAGSLKTVTYSDWLTPQVTYVYDRLGRPAEIQDAVGTRVLGYNAHMQASTEAFNTPQSPVLYSLTVTRAFEAIGTGLVPGRDAGLSVGSMYQAAYKYDSAGRLGTVTGPGLDPTYGVTYERQTNSEHVAHLRFLSSTNTVRAYAKRWLDSDRNLLDYTENRAGDPLATFSKYDYGNDDLGRREWLVNTGTAFTTSMPRHTDWDYNDRNELAASDRFLGADPNDEANPVGAEARGYLYDPIGNRNTSTEAGSTTTYDPNGLNQYETTTTPAATFDYDLDGNLISDGVSEYWWDGENRLVLVLPVNPTPASLAIEYWYDYMGRRVRKLVYPRLADNSGWGLVAVVDQRFVYDGWNVILVLNGLDSNQVQRKYTWGLDLSGSLQGAGGIGGLLACEEATGTQAGSYWFFYDGNGNVGQVLNAATLAVAAHYEYDPYGKLIEANCYGPYKDANPIRFSTKWFDNETGLGYWGYRWYSPKLGRWMSRDPIEEEGGSNLAGFVQNGPCNNIDPDGRIIVGIGGMIPYSARPQLEKMAASVKHRVNTWRKSRGLPEDTSLYIDGSVGAGLSRLDEEAKKYKDRRFPRGDRDCNAIEGFVVFGYSDGATTIYRFLEDKAEKSLSIGSGIVFLSYIAYIDMVRTHFFQLPARFPDESSRHLPLAHDYAFHRDAYYQNYDVFNIWCHGWRGYIRVGGSSGQQLSPTNHIGIINAPALEEHLVSQAVSAYIEHAEKQLAKAATAASRPERR